MHNFKVSIVNSHEAGRQHPATKWLKDTGACKNESILTRSTAALLTVAKPNKINPTLLISPSKTFKDWFKAHGGHHHHWQAMGICAECSTITRNIILILDKTTVTKMGFPFIDTDPH
jgi:hypothetical protein